MAEFVNRLIQRRLATAFGAPIFQTQGGGGQVPANAYILRDGTPYILRDGTTLLMRAA